MPEASFKGRLARAPIHAEPANFVWRGAAVSAGLLSHFRAVATNLHGDGTARAIYEALERWMKAGGAKWLRLGVVAGNTRAERFWEKCGYRELRTREGVRMGERLNTLRVMMKPLGRGSVDEYLQLVPRDQGGSP